MQAIEYSVNKNPAMLKFKESREYNISEEMKKDLEDVREGRNLIGPFNSLEELWKELDI